MANDRNTKPDADKPKLTKRQLKDIKASLSHPIRMRIIGVLLENESQTQREIGRALAMSNASVHYHLKLLEKLALVALIDTRPGPNSIVEKLYAIDKSVWELVSENSTENQDMDFYLDYTVAWMQERHREGVELLKNTSYSYPFSTGSYVVKVGLEDIVDFKQELNQLCEKFNKKHQSDLSTNQVDKNAYAVTFAVLPSQEGSDGTPKVLEFEPSLTIETN